MWKNWFFDNRSNNFEYRIDDYKALLHYINYLAKHKLGYPVSLLTYLGIVDNTIFGIKSGSIANVLLNNVGDPFKDSETSLLEVKKHEREIISILEKYYGMSPNSARGYVTTGGTEGNFASIWWSKRYIINMGLDSLIAQDNKVKLELKEEQELLAALQRIPTNDYPARATHLQKILEVKDLIAEDKNILQQLLTPTVFYTKNHTHYSVPKISEILRLNTRPIASNPDGSMDTNDFRKELLFHLGAHPHSGIIVVTNIGTTITGAIDNVPAIKEIIDASVPCPINTIHMDGALTGFVLPIIKPFGHVKNYFDEIGVNTLAVSAHKYPGMSQPCGILLASKRFFDKAFEKGERSVDYVGNISDVTISGSRSGLNVLMFYNVLITLGLDKNNDILSAMVKRNLENARYLYDKLVKLYGADKVKYPYHFNVTFPKPSQQLAKKYQLMLTGGTATICVLTNVNKKLIDNFLKDLIMDKEKTMNQKISKSEFTIQTLEEEHIKQTVELFTKTFCDSEPITKKLGLRYQEYEVFAKEVVQKAVKEGLSKVAVNKNKHVIACVIAEDLADPFIPHEAHYPKLKPVFALLSELSASFLKGKKFEKGKVFHQWIAAVDSNYRGQGLSTVIDMATIENAARKGFDFAYAEFTSEISENVTHQFKVLKLINKIQYKDFVLDGYRPFQDVLGAATAYVAAIRPGVKLEALPNCYKEQELSNLHGN